MSQKTEHYFVNIDYIYTYKNKYQPFLCFHYANKHVFPFFLVTWQHQVQQGGSLADSLTCTTGGAAGLTKHPGMGYGPPCGANTNVFSEGVPGQEKTHFAQKTVLKTEWCVPVCFKPALS